MSTTALVFWIIAIVLVAFGILFVIAGSNGERGYWSQRDPEGNARKDATKLSDIAKRPWRIASGEYRASLRIIDRKSTRLNSSHSQQSRMPSSA